MLICNFSFTFLCLWPQIVSIFQKKLHTFCIALPNFLSAFAIKINIFTSSEANNITKYWLNIFGRLVTLFLICSLEYRKFPFHSQQAYFFTTWKTSKSSRITQSSGWPSVFLVTGCQLACLCGKLFAAGLVH